MAQLLNMARATVTFLTLDLFLMFVYKNIWHLVAITMVIVFSSLIIEAHGGPRKSLVNEDRNDGY